MIFPEQGLYLPVVLALRSEARDWGRHHVVPTAEQYRYTYMATLQRFGQPCPHPVKADLNLAGHPGAFECRMCRVIVLPIFETPESA